MTNVTGTATPLADRSPLAGVAAVALMIVGLLLASYSVLIPALIGLLLLSAAYRFLSARLNPFSIGFYLPVKPSWTAIAVVALVGVVLIAAAYSDWKSGIGPIWPAHWPTP